LDRFVPVIDLCKALMHGTEGTCASACLLSKK